MFIFYRFGLIVFLVTLLTVFGAFGGSLVSADEYDDAKVAFGAFDDGLYDFAELELERFLRNHPESEMVERVRLTLILCSLETGTCQRAADILVKLEKPSAITEFGIEPATLKLRIGYCFLSAGDDNQARKLFSKLIKEYPQSDSAFKARFELGRRFFAEKNFAAANQMVTPLLTLKAKKLRLLQIERQTVYWVAALSRYQLEKFNSCLPLLQEINDDPESFSLTNKERQDLYAVTIECSWHCQKIEVLKEILQKWLQIPESELEKGKLSAALQLVAEVLRLQSRLAEIREELIKVVRLDISRDDKIIIYGLLIEIDRKKDVALKTWLEASISLHVSVSSSRIKLLRSLLLLDYKAEDYAGSVVVGNRLLADDSNFWKHELFYFPYLSSLARIGKCGEVVKYVPSSLPPYDKVGSLNQQRYLLDIMAGNCLQKLERFGEAIVLYRSMYAHYSDPLIRVTLLAALHSLASKIVGRQNLDDWISAQVINFFPLDKRENEKLLREFPELVLLVADHFFRAQAYLKAQPSLLWLESLSLKGAIADRITFLLAEAYYRCEDLGEALIRYQALYEGDSKGFRYFAVLRLVTIYEAQGYHGKQIKLYKDLLRWESDVAVKEELQRKLEVLEK